MRDSTYAITGNSAAELVAAMRAHGLVDRAGDRVFALTTWYVDWTYDWVTLPGGRCAIGNLDVRVDIHTTLPTWKLPSTADAQVIAGWRRFTEALLIHERGHAQNGLDRAAEIASAMAGIDPELTCSALESSADAAAAAILAEGRRWDVLYDDETDHGATQGAIFS